MKFFIFITLLLFVVFNPKYVLAQTVTPTYCPQISTVLYSGLKDSGTNMQVSELQKFLKSYFSLEDNKFIVCGVYGAITKKYVIEYQNANNIKATGVVGNITKNSILANCVNETINTIPTTGASSSESTIGIKCPKLTKDLMYGIVDEEVKELQTFYKKYYNWTPKFMIDGTYDSTTLRITTGFQTEKNILVTGIVDANTRSFIQKLCSTN